MISLSFYAILNTVRFDKNIKKLENLVIPRFKDNPTTVFAPIVITRQNSSLKANYTSVFMVLGTPKVF